MNFTHLKVAEVAKRELLLLPGAYQFNTTSKQATRLVDEQAVDSIRVYVNWLETKHEKLRNENTVMSEELSAQLLLVKEYTTHIEMLKCERDKTQVNVEFLREKCRAEEVLTKDLHDQIKDLKESNKGMSTQLAEVLEDYVTQVDLVQELQEEMGAVLRRERKTKHAWNVRQRDI